MDKKANKMSKEELKDWKVLCEYVKNDILQYDDTKKFPKQMVLRLKGLSQGKFMANKKTKAQANYPFKIIYTTFIINKNKILKSMAKKEFKNEQHKVNYIMIIIESNINDVVDIIKRKKKSESKTLKLDLNNQLNDSAEYKKRKKEDIDKKFSDLW